MPTYLTPIVAKVDASGISAPSFADILAWIQQQYQTIYGADTYLGNDSQDGQWLGVLAAAFTDANSMAVAVYEAFSPTTAQGVGLSQVVKINGIARLASSFSTAQCLIGGNVGKQILNGTVIDENQNTWLLPASVTVPGGGEITVTVTSLAPGAISASAGTVQIGTPTLGWNSAAFASDATPGSPVETDPALKARQTRSTSLPALTIIDAIVGNLLNLPGVIEVMPYVNDTGSTDADGVTEHAIAIVINGGNAQAIVNVIGAGKAPGSNTFGTTTQTYVDAYGRPQNIKFSFVTLVPITTHITITALANYTGTIGDNIVQAVIDYINALPIGQNVLYTRLFVPANLSNGAGSETFELNSVLIARSGSPGAADAVIAFNEEASCDLGHMTLTVM